MKNIYNSMLACLTIIGCGQLKPDIDVQNRAYTNTIQLCQSDWQYAYPVQTQGIRMPYAPPPPAPRMYTPSASDMNQDDQEETQEILVGNPTFTSPKRFPALRKKAGNLRRRLPRLRRRRPEVSDIDTTNQYEVEEMIPVAPNV